MKRCLLLGVCLLLAACAAPGTSTPAPTPQAINIFYPTDLQAWANQLSNCASGNPLVALYFFTYPIAASDPTVNDITLEFGNPTNPPGSSFITQVGSDQVVVITNQANDSSQLSLEHIRSIFSGKVSQWEDGQAQPIQVWVLPEGDPTRTIFDSVVLPGQPVTTEAMLAPDSQAMLEAVAQNENSIGYLTKSILSSADPTLIKNVKTLQLDQSTQAALYQPVLALTKSEPKGYLRDLLVCLQSSKP
jgi:PBP superfamily domain